MCPWRSGGAGEKNAGSSNATAGSHNATIIGEQRYHHRNSRVLWMIARRTALNLFGPGYVTYMKNTTLETPN
ncbi:hypothetical protein L1987_23697 [Smallanthus sonchifolius]|uniref:Uncharacterized protein n=1 Tax=Smallanthus sonchifolius TaxID=185202 RepID=A0ACB9IJA0_9ASTR|nr:hypothetical protein L1987_23697 [Smallanthus sonchifolius]